MERGKERGREEKGGRRGGKEGWREGGGRREEESWKRTHTVTGPRYQRGKELLTRLFLRWLNWTSERSVSRTVCVVR